MTGAATTRRGLLRLGVSVAALAALPGGALARSLNGSRDQALFTSVLYTLAGPVEVAPQLLDSVTTLFTAKFGEAALDALVAHAADAGVADLLSPQTDSAREAQVQWLTGALFTGSADPSEKTSQMVNYPYALGWKALSFAKAPGLCSGPDFGYWSTDWGRA